MSRLCLFIFSFCVLTVFARILPPYTVHAVLTTDNSISVGGHFYSNLHFDRTLVGFMAEHYAGNELTNASHAEAAVTLFRTLIYAHNCIFDNEALHGSLADEENWSKLDGGWFFFLVQYCAPLTLLCRHVSF